jgi:hypothetical protein
MERCRRWVFAAKRPVIANIGPDPAGDSLQFRQYEHRRVIGVDAFRAHDMGPDRLNNGSSANTQAPTRSAGREHARAIAKSITPPVRNQMTLIEDRRDSLRELPEARMAESYHIIGHGGHGVRGWR